MFEILVKTDTHWLMRYKVRGQTKMKWVKYAY